MKHKKLEANCCFQFFYVLMLLVRDNDCIRF